MYCKNDSTLVCGKCVYGDQDDNEIKNKKRPKSSLRSPHSKIDNLPNSSHVKLLQDPLHEKHNLRQLCDAVLDVDQDNRSWNFDLKGEMNRFNVEQKKWNKNKEMYENLKTKIFIELEEKYD